jgi:hypothetical protein
MWLKNDVLADVDRVCRIHYVNVLDCKQWNEHRRENEIRLMTGWCWIARNGSAYRHGFKTYSICARDAYYALVQKTEAPIAGRPRLRVVTSERKTA